MAVQATHNLCFSLKKRGITWQWCKYGRGGISGLIINDNCVSSGFYWKLRDCATITDPKLGRKHSNHSVWNLAISLKDSE